MNEENIEEILKSIGKEEIPADVHKIAQETSSSFSSSLRQTKQPKRLILLEQIMRSRTTRLAAAAVIFVAVLAGLPFLGPNGPGVALAEVLAKVEQARAFMYKVKITMTRDVTTGMPSEQEIAVTVSNDYGIKWDMHTTDPNTGKEVTDQMYILPNQKMVVGLMHEMKQYMRMELDEGWLARVKKQNNDPREVIKQIMNCKYTALGRSAIDGVEVVGFQTRDSAYFGGSTKEHVFTLWVDAENWLPFRSETSVEKDGELRLSEVTYDYQWDIPVYADEFEPIIPEDYTAAPADGVRMPGMSEKAAIEGLKLFSEMTGRYPKKLSMLELAQEIAESLKSSDYIFEELGKLKEEMSVNGEPAKEELRDAAIKRTTALTQPLQSPGWFYSALFKDNREPAYYGESVGPDDTGAVLMRWEISEDRYRVIFGDLTAEDVTAEELAELENTL